MNSDVLIDTLREDDSWWTRVRMTPWRDLLRGRVSGSLDYREAMAEFDLPLPLLRVVDNVVQQTRLWPTERSDVATELCNHFADGLQAGHSVDELQQLFGSTKESAKLIRRSKVRCRSLSWQIWRRTVQVFAVLAFVAVAVWSILLIRFATAKPTITFDLVASHDDDSLAIPEDERAWPLYRAGILQAGFMSGSSGTSEQADIIAALDEGPTHEHWADAQAYLADHRDSIELFLEGTERAHLGFIHRDPENADWLQTVDVEDWADFPPADTSVFASWDWQTGAIRSVRRILVGETHAAVEKGDGEQVVDLLIGHFRLAGHAREASPRMETDWLAFGFLRNASERIASLVVDQPQLFNDAGLSRLARELDVTLGGGPLEYRWDAHHLMLEDLLQRSFTDDGAGNGRFTSQGLLELRATYDGWGLVFEDETRLPMVEQLPYSKSLERGDVWDSLWFQFYGSVAVNRVADRQTMQERMFEAERIHRRAVSADSDDAGVLAFQQLMHDFADSPSLRERLLPVAFVYQFYDVMGFNDGVLLKTQSHFRDAARVAIALEQYRRQHGNWPDDLEALTPEFLRQVPVDLNSRERAPLKYRLIENQPVLYSVGANQQDDGGTVPESAQNIYDMSRANEGDWVLLPPWEPSD